MSAFMSIRETASQWGCSVRSVQMLCKEGRIPGAVKLSGVWLLPKDTPRPGTGLQRNLPAFAPESLYGSSTVRVSPGAGLLHGEQSGCNITAYRILDGITMVFQEIHEEQLDYGTAIPRLPGDLIAIQHCREGRFEGEYPNGECIYMGPGSLSVNLPAWSPVAHSFPLRYYYGFYIAIEPRQAESAIRALEQILGPLHIDFSAITERLSAINRLALYAPDDHTVRLLSAFYPDRSELPEEQLKLRVLSLLQLLSVQQIQPPGPEQYFPRDQVNTVKAIRQYLIDHLDEHLPLPELAAKFHISLTAMKTCFKGIYGQPMGKYLREYRMQLGAEQLRTTNLRIIDIAAGLGYENASKFSEAFAAYFGLLPSAYRKTICPQGGFPSEQE